MSVNCDGKKIRIEGINPILNVSDIAVSKGFYIGMLGFSEAEWGDDNFTCITRDNAAIYLCKGGQGAKEPGFGLDLMAIYSHCMMSSKVKE